MWRRVTGLSVMLVSLGMAAVALAQEGIVVSVRPDGVVIDVRALADVQAGSKVSFVRSSPDRTPTGQGLVLDAREGFALVRLGPGASVAEQDRVLLCPGPAARAAYDQLRVTAERARATAGQSGDPAQRPLFDTASEILALLGAFDMTVQQGSCDTLRFDAMIMPRAERLAALATQGVPAPWAGQPAQPYAQTAQPYAQSAQPSGQAAQSYGPAIQPYRQPPPSFGAPAQPYGQPAPTAGLPAQPYGQVAVPSPGQPSTPYGQPLQSPGPLPYGQPPLQAGGPPAWPYPQATLPSGQPVQPGTQPAPEYGQPTQGPGTPPYGQPGQPAAPFVTPYGLPAQPAGQPLQSSQDPGSTAPPTAFGGVASDPQGVGQSSSGSQNTLDTMSRAADLAARVAQIAQSLGVKVGRGGGGGTAFSGAAPAPGQAVTGGTPPSMGSSSDQGSWTGSGSGSGAGAGTATPSAGADSSGPTAGSGSFGTGAGGGFPGGSGSASSSSQGNAGASQGTGDGTNQTPSSSPATPHRHFARLAPSTSGQAPNQPPDQTPNAPPAASPRHFVRLAPATPGAPATGSSVMAAVTGRVQSANGQPLVSASVVIGGTGSAQVHTDSQGRFTVRNLRPGQYTVSVTAPNFQPQSQPLALQAGQVGQVSVTLQPQSPGPLRPVLRPLTP